MKLNVVNDTHIGGMSKEQIDAFGEWFSSGMVGPLWGGDVFVSSQRRKYTKIHRLYFKNKITGEVCRTRIEKKGSSYYYLDDKNHTRISRYKLLKYWEKHETNTLQ